ncbi:MAG: type I-D CRISPR-associated protein Cas7/Csc2 [Leptospirillum sp.]
MPNHNMESFYNFLATEIVMRYELSSTPFDIPSLPEAQCIVIPVIREAVAPILVRNNDADDVTDMFLEGANRVRMIASKTKGVERRRGSQILRAIGMGGKIAANKAFIPKGKKVGDYFDLNTFVFGDAGKGEGSAIYPVHAAVLYSDALSVRPKKELINDVFRTGGIYEDGGNFNSDSKESSSNIFTTYAVNPGTFFVQSLVIPGHRMTKAAFDHLLLSVGLAGSYGGQTAVTGTNIRTHLVGVFWGKMERSLNAPMEMLRKIGEEHSLEGILSLLESEFRSQYPHFVDKKTLDESVASLVARLEEGEPSLLAQYAMSYQKVSDLFNAWFGTVDKKERKSKRETAELGNGGESEEEDAVNG